MPISLIFRYICSVYGSKWADELSQDWRPICQCTVFRLAPIPVNSHFRRTLVWGGSEFSFAPIWTEVFHIFRIWLMPPPHLTGMRVKLNTSPKYTFPGTSKYQVLNMHPPTYSAYSLLNVRRCHQVLSVHHKRQTPSERAPWNFLLQI